MIWEKYNPRDIINDILIMPSMVRWIKGVLKLNGPLASPMRLETFPWALNREESK